MFENLIAALKADKRKIVFTEGPDARILEAAARLKKDGLMDSILVGNVDEVKAAAANAAESFADYLKESVTDTLQGIFKQE